MLKKFLKTFAILALSASAYAYNPAELFTHLETVSFTKRPDTFYYFETDFDKDGAPELWIAHDKSHVGGNGLYFHVYRKVGDSYIMFDETPTLDTRLLAFAAKDGSDAANGTARVLSYFKYDSQSGALVSYKIENDKIVEHKYREVRPLDDDKELFDSIFSDSHKIAKEIPAGEFREFLKGRGIKCPVSDKIKFLAIDLGGTTGKTVFASNPDAGFAASAWLAYHKDGGKWKKLSVHPKDHRLVFFENFSCIRKIDGRKFLICLTQDAPRKTILSFYHIANDKICAFEFRYLEIDERDVVLDHPEAADDYAFLAALDFDFDEERKSFHYLAVPKSQALDKDGEIKIADGIEVEKLSEIKEIKLPEGNGRTEQFRKLWKESLKD